MSIPDAVSHYPASTLFRRWSCQAEGMKGKVRKGRLLLLADAKGKWDYVKPLNRVPFGCPTPCSYITHTAFSNTCFHPAGAGVWVPASPPSCRWMLQPAAPLGGSARVSPHFLGSPCSVRPRGVCWTKQRCCSGASCLPCCVWARWGLAGGWGCLWPCVSSAPCAWGTGTCCPWGTEPCSSQVRCCQGTAANTKLPFLTNGLENFLSSR